LDGIQQLTVIASGLLHHYSDIETVIKNGGLHQAGFEMPWYSITGNKLWIAGSLSTGWPGTLPWQ